MLKINAAELATLALWTSLPPVVHVDTCLLNPYHNQMSSISLNFEVPLL